ncbi:putative adhesin [Streptomyces sp. NPDC057101]|uniref:putative adhesin n=1 Tax=Streptomyces sp. NPDC057101 TaxID=3346020 RepID=UPI003643F38C
MQWHQYVIACHGDFPHLSEVHRSPAHALAFCSWLLAHGQIEVTPEEESAAGEEQLLVYIAAAHERAALHLSGDKSVLFQYAAFTESAYAFVREHYALRAGAGDTGAETAVHVQQPAPVAHAAGISHPFAWVDGHGDYVAGSSKCLVPAGMQINFMAYENESALTYNVLKMISRGEAAASHDVYEAGQAVENYQLSPSENPNEMALYWAANTSDAPLYFAGHGPLDGVASLCHAERPLEQCATEHRCGGILDVLSGVQRLFFTSCRVLRDDQRDRSTYRLPGEKIPRHAIRRHLEVTVDSIMPRSMTLSKLKKLPDERVALRRGAYPRYDAMLIIDGQKELAKNRDEGGVFAFLAYYEGNPAEQEVLNKSRNLRRAREEALAYVAEFVADSHPSKAAKWGALTRAERAFLKERRDEISHWARTFEM